MANIPAQLYRGDSDYLGTISNVDGQILFDSDKKEIFVDDGTTRESYGGGAGDKTYATLAQAEADIANISEKDTVFVKEGTSASLTQRVDDLEDEVEQINTDLSDLMNIEVTQTETLIGKFGNDNLYRRVYTLTNIPVVYGHGTTIDASLNVAYVKNLVRLYGSGKMNYGPILPLNCSNVQVAIHGSDTGLNVSFAVSGGSYTIEKGVLIVEYTKN